MTCGRVARLAVPWPRDGFGLERMRALLAELGDPQDAYPAIHVVGTNGKSTATITIEQLLLSRRALGRLDDLAARRGLERADPGGRRGGRLRGGGRSRPRAGGAARRDPVRDRDRCRARRLRGRARSTSPSSRPGSAAATTRRTSCARGSSSSRTSGSSTPTCSATRSRRSRARSSRSRRTDASSCSQTRRYAHARARSEIRDRRRARGRRGVRRPRDRRRAAGLAPRPSRAARRTRSGTVRTIPTVCATSSSGSTPVTTPSSSRSSRDKNADEMLRELRRAGARFVATQSSLARALPAADLAELARASFPARRGRGRPGAAVARAHELGEPVLVTGSLYLLGDLAQAERRAAWPA